MTEDEISRRLDAAAQVNDAFREVSDTLNGAVSTLIAEGWTDAQAREIVVTQWINAVRASWK